MLPMSHGRCSLVWCHPQSRRDEVLGWSDERFCEQLQQAFGWRLGRITHAGKRSVYPLALTTATRRFPIAWRWSVMRRRRCIPSPGRALISACAM
jgi:2-octaprenyl-6-methoxyphenol hydroxylase